jgi:hypothetical protein
MAAVYENRGGGATASDQGFFLEADNECERKRDKPSATRKEAPARPEKPAREVQAPPAKPQAQTSGQVFCNQQGCRPVAKGCVIGGGGRGTNHGGGQREVCF